MMLKITTAIMVALAVATAQAQPTPAPGPAIGATDIEAISPAIRTTLATDALRALPQATASIRFGNPPAAHAFSGPLLFDALVAARLVDPANHSAIPRQTLRIQGVDGYLAIIALGEISPEFEAKPAIIAVTMDAAPLPHPRVIIPGDRRAGRSVRDVVRLTVDELAKQ